MTEIAKRANVSVATVSMVVNNRSEISRKTASKVRHVMRQLNYNPPPPEQRRGRNAVNISHEDQINTVGLICINTAISGVFARFLEKIEFELKKHHKMLLFTSVKTLNSPEGINAIAEADACIIIGYEDQAVARKLLGNKLCVWAMGESRHQYFCDTVTPDQELTGLMGAEYLLERGHRKIVYVVPYHTFHINTANAFLSAAPDKAGIIKVDAELHEEAQQRGVDACEIIREQLLTMTPQVTGLMLPSNMIGLLNFIEDLKLDILYIDLIQENGYKGKVNIIDPNVEQIAEEAVRVLLWRFENPHKARIKQLVAPNLTEFSPRKQSIYSL